jgi:hypothetical protein
MSGLTIGTRMWEVPSAAASLPHPRWRPPPRRSTRRGKLRQGLARLIDGYAEGLLLVEEAEPRIRRICSSGIPLAGLLRHAVGCRPGF